MRLQYKWYPVLALGLGSIPFNPFWRSLVKLTKTTYFVYGVWHALRSYNMVVVPRTIFTLIPQSFICTCTHLNLHVVFANLIAQSRDHLPRIEHCESLSFWSLFRPNSFPMFIFVGHKTRMRRESCVVSLEQFWRNKRFTLCRVLLFSSVLSIYPVTVLYFGTGIYGSTTLFVMWWFGLQEYTNTSTLTLVSFRQ
jgi:hypothetical protein